MSEFRGNMADRRHPPYGEKLHPAPPRGFITRVVAPGTVADLPSPLLWKISLLLFFSDLELVRSRRGGSIDSSNIRLYFFSILEELINPLFFDLGLINFEYTRKERKRIARLGKWKDF